VLGPDLEWSPYPIVRGNAAALFQVAIIVGAATIASELVLRGWVVERVFELGGGRALAVLAGALGEALVSDGELGARLGAAVFGAGLTWMYIASGRSLVPGTCARLAFTLGALILEALRLVG
jgi:hypothetical protein